MNEEKERYARAAATLNDARLAAQYARTLQRLAGAPQPEGLILWESELFRRSRRVGLLAGSFNPLTRAHVALAQAARGAGRLDAMLWALSVVIVDKERVERASLVDRLLQMRAFVEDGPDALALFNRGLYVEQAELAWSLMPHLEELVIVVGFDKIIQIFDPRYYEDRDAVLDRLFASATILVAPRVDEDEESLNALLTRPENRRYQARVGFCPLPRRFRGDSSSRARSLASEPGSGRQLRALLPPEGRALVRLTGAYTYGARRAGRAQRQRDVYPLRQSVIEQLAALDPAQVAAAPGLDGLLKRRKDHLSARRAHVSELERTSRSSEERG